MKTILLLITVIFLVLTIRHLMLKFFMNIVIGRKTFNFRQFDKEKYHQLAPADDFSDDWITKQELTTLRINSSRDGVNLSGHFLLAEEPVRTIILFHGWRSEFKCDFAEMAENLNRNGCNLLFVEQRAHGNSGGKYIGFGALERYDCIDWLKYLTDTNHNLPIYLAGLSMGASTVLMAAEFDLPETVKGIIADCGFTSPYEIVIKVANLYHLKTRTVNHIDRMCYKKTGFNLNNLSTLRAMDNCRVPILFIHGTADNLIPFEMTVKNYHACRSKKKLLLIEGAEHCKSFSHDKKKYYETMCSFFGWNPILQNDG